MGADRVQRVKRNTRDPSARPESWQARSYKPKAKSRRAQRESEGIVVLAGAAQADDGAVLTSASSPASLEFSLERDKLRQVRRREGRYLLRTNLTAQQPDALWTFCIQLAAVEQAFKEIKHDLAIRPIFHKTEQRIEAHIFVAFLA